jgi:hypothetical protein
MNEELEKLLLEADNAVNDNKKLSMFFNNSSMSRILDVLLDNPNLKINIEEVLYKAGLSRKSIQVNVPLLLENNIIIEEHLKYYKFYQLNQNNPLVKQITQFRDILSVNNVFIEKRLPTTTGRKPNKKENNRRVNTRLSKETRTTKQSKDARKPVQKKSTYKK